MTPEDDVQALRNALEAGPADGPWVDRQVQGMGPRRFLYAADSNWMPLLELDACSFPTAAFIAAASPDRIRRILDRLEAAEKANERQEDALNRLQEWARAYPLECFPEPDFKKAHQLLLAGGMTLDAISASNMRHVITQVAAIVDEAQKGTPS